MSPRTEVNGRSIPERRRERRWWIMFLAVVLAAGIARLYAPPHAGSVHAEGSGGAGVARADEVDLLARVIAAEAEGEPYVGQVAVGAVILNRVRSPEFPNTLAGVIYQPLAFESVSNGLIWRRTPRPEARQAAWDALNGWDPTYGALFFWNPYKPVSPWVWTRQIITQIGNHVFAR